MTFRRCHLWFPHRYTDLMKSHLMLNIPQQKLYGNSLMVVLNARQIWKDSIEQSQTSDVSLMDVSRTHC